MQIATRPPLPGFRKPNLEEFQQLFKPAPGEGLPVIPGRRAQEPLPETLDDVRKQVAELDFHPLDPFVASVAGSVSASQPEIPKGETSVGINLPDFYSEEVEVLLGTHNGPDAPMLVILPGIYADGAGSHSNLLKKLALERGMNYVLLPNSMSEAMMDDKPRYHPGNPRVDAQWARQAIGQLQERYPEYFTRISVAGYSYGALQGANLIRLDEEHPDSERRINGSLVVQSPPENLESSMKQLDGLRQSYAQGSGSITEAGIRYKHDVKKYGYERFFGSPLSEHGPGTNITEIEMADKYGSRDNLKKMVETVDTQFHHNLLPMNTEAYKKAGLMEKYRMRQEHKQIVEDMTYDQLSSNWICKDEWLAQQGLTPSQMAEQYSFSRAIEAIDRTPVLMLAAADDYILAPQDVEKLKNLETGDLEVTRVFDAGGHVGLDWNPKIAETMIDFAAREN